MVVGSPFNRNMPRMKNVEEAVDSTLFMCWSILKSEHIVVTPSIHMAFSLDEPVDVSQSVSMQSLALFQLALQLPLCLL